MKKYPTKYLLSIAFLCFIFYFLGTYLFTEQVIAASCLDADTDLCSAGDCPDLHTCVLNMAGDRCYCRLNRSRIDDVEVDIELPEEE